jgi:A/G-specific adenine glycosylase
MDRDQFKKRVWSFYAENKRVFPWRHEIDPYKVVVSEVMLQQTQTGRVVEKYNAFMNRFPTVHHLALASFTDVLLYWNGLGYNRRALFLHKLSQIVVEKHQGTIPADEQFLVELPGIGKATASSICAFAFNKPVVFIETNIRTVFLYHFFPLQEGVDDKQLFPLIEEVVDLENPRDWYYALMDYGVYLKQSLPNPSRKSKHHTKQSKFQGSDRQIRGAILRALLEHKKLVFDQVLGLLKSTEEQRIRDIIQTLVKDGLIVWNQENGTIVLC